MTIDLTIWVIRIIRGLAEYLHREVNPHLTEKKIGFGTYIETYLTTKEGK